MQGLSNDVLKCRANHDMLAIEMNRLGNRTVFGRVVVSPDRRIIESLENDGLWGAYSQICAAINIITQGLGARSFDPSRTNGRSGNHDHGATLLIKYHDWYDVCNRRHLAPLLVRKMIVDGMSMNAIDKEYKFYKGASKIKIWKCLEAWSEV